MSTHTPGGSPELNLISIYQTDAPHGVAGNVAVHVEAGGPMVLFLASYELAHWVVTAEPGVVLERILVNGYYPPTVDGPDGVATETYSVTEGTSPVSCGYELPPLGSCDTIELIAWAEAVAGRKLTAFAGCYEATTFSVCTHDPCETLTCNAPAPLTIECADIGGTSVSDTLIEGWLASVESSGGCGSVGISHDAPALFPATCSDSPQPTTVTFTAADEKGNSAQCVSSVTVIDATAPMVELTQTASCLWPPNHQFSTVAEVSVTDICDPKPRLEVRATSDEATATAPGTGGTAHCPDARLLNGSLQLRAERAGPSGADNGRVYGAAAVLATDACGNFREAGLLPATAEGCPGVVCVPHDRDLGPRACLAADDGQLDATICN